MQQKQSYHLLMLASWSYFGLHNSCQSPYRSINLFSHLSPFRVHNLILNLLTSRIPHSHRKLTHHLSLIHPPCLLPVLCRFGVQRKLPRPHCELVDLLVGWGVEVEYRGLYWLGRVRVLDCWPELFRTVDGLLCAFLLVHVCLLDGLVQELEQLLL